MTRRGRAIHRVDTTAKALTQAARDLGFEFHPQDGVLDGTLWWPPTGRIIEVDFKSAGGDLTSAQTKLVAQGWPVKLISRVEQLEQLIREMR